MDEKLKSAFIDTMTNHHMNWTMYGVLMITLYVLCILSPMKFWDYTIAMFLCNIVGVAAVIYFKTMHTYRSEESLQLKTYNILTDLANNQKRQNELLEKIAKK